MNRIPRSWFNDENHINNLIQLRQRVNNMHIPTLEERLRNLNYNTNFKTKHNLLKHNNIAG